MNVQKGQYVQMEKGPKANPCTALNMVGEYQQLWSNEISFCLSLVMKGNLEMY